MPTPGVHRMAGHGNDPGTRDTPAFLHSLAMRPHPFSALAGLVLLIGLLPAVSFAKGPYLPTSDAQVLERLPQRQSDPDAREQQRLRLRLNTAPRDLDAAVRLVRLYLGHFAADGDPRYIGYAEAALAPWWPEAQPPLPARLMRAVLRQYSHEFGAAVADLKQVVAEQPDHGEGWAWLAAIAMVEARYDDARAACDRVQTLAPALSGPGCVAAVRSITGDAAGAAQLLRQALQAHADAPPAERLWAWTRLGEIEERRGRWAEAEAAFRSGLALKLEDSYLLAAYADFLLDRGRPADVIALLKGKERSDLLLLRLALAGKQVASAQGPAWARDLGARFDAARLRGDVLHQKEEARHALGVLGDAARALPLAQANFAVQREPADARVLLEAALAARQAKAAQPVLDWMARSRIESVALAQLADRLKALP